MELCLDRIDEYDDNDIMTEEELASWVRDNKRVLTLLGELMACEPLNGDTKEEVVHHTWIATNERPTGKPIMLYWSGESEITIEYFMADYQEGVLKVAM